MSISGVRSSSGVNQTQMVRMNQTAKTRSDKLVQDLDANKDGGLDKKSLCQAWLLTLPGSQNR